MVILLVVFLTVEINLTIQQFSNNPLCDNQIIKIVINNEEVHKYLILSEYK